jgi:hypothetical protein
MPCLGHTEVVKMGHAAAGYCRSGPGYAIRMVSPPSMAIVSPVM